MDDFECEFGHKIELEGATFEKDSGTIYKYFCFNNVIEDYKHYMYDWLKKHSFPSFSLTVGSYLYLHGDELFDDQIKVFEEEFGLRCLGYSISCSSGRFEYKFSS